MNTETTKTPSDSPAPADSPALADTHAEIPLAYAGASRMMTDDDQSQLSLFGNLKRDPVQLDGEIKDPLRWRSALAALYAIVGSDFRYKPKDRTVYNAYRRMKSQSANLNVWEAQHAYFDWLAENDPLAFFILDPVITVHPDKLHMEVFSRDEGSYARLSVDLDALKLKGKPVCGTTNIDFSEHLFNNVMRFRSYRKTRLRIDQQAVEIKTKSVPEVLEKQIKIPHTWLRGFLQVQSAAMLPTEQFKLAPMDLYNLLRHLRMRADERRKRRGLRIELVPGQVPRLVLEPWETVLPATSEPYAGQEPRVVRVWGRRRLMLLRQLLPYVEEVTVNVMGSGLPSFWTLKAGPIQLTLGLTGFTAANWSQSIDFDLILPRNQDNDKDVKKVIKHLARVQTDDRAGLEKATKLKDEALTAALQAGCQQGQLMYDILEQRYGIRPLTAEPLDLDRLEFRNAAERTAYDLVGRQKAVAVTQENQVFGLGVELTGKVVVAEDKRDYRPQLLLSEEGFVSRAECTCTQFRKSGMTGGPCVHLIALRLAYGQLQQDRKAGQKQDTVTVQTKTFSKRSGNEESRVQLSLNQRRLQVNWGTVGQPMRRQQLQFSTPANAREEYFRRVEALNEKGYLDASG